MKTTNKLVLTEQHEQLITWDFDGKEKIELAIFGLSESKGERELIVSEIYSPLDEEYIHRSSGSASLRSDSVFRIYEKALVSGRRAVGTAHTHPGKAYVSNRDQQDAEKHLKVLRDFNIDFYLQIISGDEGIVAVIYRFENGEWHRDDIDYIKIYRRNGISIVLPTNSQFTPNFSVDEGIHERTLQIGGGINYALVMFRLLKLGIVGMGGVGNSVAHILKHLGVENWVLVDPDILELSNANRFFGYHQGEDDGKPKVEVARRELMAFNPEMKIDVYQESFPSEKTKQALKTCDLLIFAPDDDHIRLMGSDFASLYCKPLFTAGAAIYVDEAGKPFRISGAAWFQHAPQLGPCLRCLGIKSNHPSGIVELVDRARRSYIKGGHGQMRTPASIISLHLQCANLLVRNILYYLSNIGESVPLYTLFDEIPLIISDLTSMFPRQEGCTICGSKGFWSYADYAPSLPSKKDLEADLEVDPPVLFSGGS